jgi:REP-associated tyrosine transposase
MDTKISSRLRQLLYEACRLNSWWISELSIQEDHVHIMVQIPPRYRVAEVVQIFKGVTSRILRLEYPEMKEFLWGDSLWADGYFAESVGKENEEVKKK